MEISNKIREGLHQDNNILDQPPDTMRDNFNGVITDLGNGNFKWSPVTGNTFSFTVPDPNKYFSHCAIRNRFFIISLNVNGAIVKIYELSIANHIGTLVEKYSGSNTDWNLSFNYPIRAIFGFYESDDIQRIYLTDFNNQPRCIDVGSSSNPAITIDSKFLNFSPVIEHVYGNFLFKNESTAGTLKAGTYFFAWRYYTNTGYYTDWSWISNPIQISCGITGTTYNAYQNMQGGAPDENTTKSIVFDIENIDTDYPFIQVCSFYSNDYNITNPGNIIYDGDTDISGTIEITYYGGENLGTVTIDDLIETSIMIDKCKDMVYGKKKNIIANIEERDELDLDYYIDATAFNIQYHVMLDSVGYKEKMAAVGEDKALFGVHTADYEAANNILRIGLWYRVTSVADLDWRDNFNTSHVFHTGEVFYIPTTTQGPHIHAGTFEPVIVISKYIKAGGNEFGDYNTERIFDVIPLYNEYMDYKSPKISYYLKGYPQGEKVRFGILFFDKTGRPFMVRHLRCTGIGHGDVDIWNRSEIGQEPIVVPYNIVTAGTDYYYMQTNASVTGVRFDDIDITDIKDIIGGFMIVRAPIIRQHQGMGILSFTYLNGNDVYSYPCFRNIASDTHTYSGCYDFYCPEDLFNFKDFTIQKGDMIENIYYLKPYVQNEQEVTAGPHTWRGFGRIESDAYDFYYKLLRQDSSIGAPANGLPGISHEVLAATKYEIGTDAVSVNPLDVTKLYNDYAFDMYPETIGAGHTGKNCTHTILMLDIDEGVGNINKKGYFSCPIDAPKVLLCSVKRPNADPYGGYSASSADNSIYITTGHYQEINPTVLADIESNGTYIFHGIHVFGGDTFINLFDYKRIISDGGQPISHAFGQSVIFPVESRINIAMREGDHVAQVRSYDSGFNTSGIRMMRTDNRFEEFNYNDGYSTDDVNDYYVPVPNNYTPVSKFDVRIRFSSEKSYGENRDSFRRFSATDRIDLDGNKGEINNIRYGNERLVYWQPDEVGYVPVGERALTQNEMGQPVQLGVGGIFERYDRIVDKIGNSNQFGLVESPNGFHWYDSLRKIFWSIGHNLQIIPDSIVKGMDKFYTTTILDDMYLYDNPISSYGTYGCYDPMTKMVYYGFNMSDDTKYMTGIHPVLNKFIGFYGVYPGVMFNHMGHMYAGHTDLFDFYVCGIGDPFKYFGIQNEAYVTLVVKEESNVAKIFDTFELLGNGYTFSSIRCQTETQDITEVITSCDPSSGIEVNNLKYLKGRWFGNYPKYLRARLSGAYLMITFKIEQNYNVMFNELKTNVRKIY